MEDKRLCMTGNERGCSHVVIVCGLYNQMSACRFVFWACKSNSWLRFYYNWNEMKARLTDYKDISGWYLYCVILVVLASWLQGHYRAGRLLRMVLLSGLHICGCREWTSRAFAHRVATTTLLLRTPTSSSPFSSHHALDTIR